MHSILPAPSQNNIAHRPALLILSVSGRALAAAARRAGFRPFVADLFNDADTLELAERAVLLSGSLRNGVDHDHIREKLRALMAGERPTALVYGSGFESKPELIDFLSREFPLAGNSAQTIREVKNPANLARLCREIGISHPEIRFEAPSNPDGWVTKLAGGAGGGHVRAAAGAKPEPSRYFQAFVSGENVSALFLARQGKAHIVGFSRQWSAPSGAMPFRYGGAVRLARYDREKRDLVKGWLDALVERTGLVGLCSADFIEGSDGLHLIEINPRPGATLDIFDSGDAPLLIQHLRAVSGEKIRLPLYRDVTASAIAYTAEPIAVFPDIPWPALTADHQKPGTALCADDPVCTVFARARTADAAERAVKNSIHALASHWKEGLQ